MVNEYYGVILIISLTFLLSIPLGRYISKIFNGEKVWSDFLNPLEHYVFKIAGIDPHKSMDWKENSKALLRINFIFFLWSFIILLIQGDISLLNPANIFNMDSTLAFNTASSFTSNTNLQHYSGESGLSYLSQMIVISFLQFVSAATGMAALALFIKGLLQKKVNNLGNFYDLFLKSCTRILLPLSSIVAFILLLNGVPSTFDAPSTLTTLEGEVVIVSTGPAAPMIAIKQLGTNGGGFFGTNSSHPFENANYLTNVVETVSLAIIPIALIFAFGFLVKNKKLGLIFYSVMTIFFILFTISAVKLEVNGNPEITRLGISQPIGSMEGKEIRIGSAASALWAVTTTSTSNGSVNAMSDSMTPLTGGILLIDMSINAIYGGVGVGFLNFFMYVIIAVFIGGLMVGRTPEFLGKKIEVREIKIAVILILLHPFLILTGTAISTYIATLNPNIGWLNNPSYHGFSQMLYEFTSAAANNGSGFEGLSDNTPFWNISTGIVMLLNRFIPIIGAIAIGGFFASKNTVPFSEGTLRADSLAFGVILFGVIFIIAALAFLPALTLGPIAEFFSM